MIDREERKEQLRTWVEPKIDTLAIEETESFGGAGRDGGRYATSQRS
ncbi:MAG TPA: hypothetical protein VHG29_09645 [Novosphingobium sp.]|nr:hypothetical protein [Novosphingobium sp.]